jgi:hypothetical protein
VKIKIPDQLKAEVPLTKWGKVLNATPVVMTVIATMLAGLSSSEMTGAQYQRSLATQQQSKAGDQWGFYQAKRLRGAMQSGTLDLLANTGDLQAVDAAALQTAIGPLAGNPDAEAAIRDLLAGQLPPAAAPAAPDPKVQAALEASESALADSGAASVLAGVTDAAVAAELRAARNRAQAFDETVSPVTRTIEQIATVLDAHRSDHPPLNRDFTALRLHYAIRRYEAEARLNQAIANLYELQVRKSNLAAERHLIRSQRFFYGMLAAQAGVVIATFAVAARKRNFLWSVAAAAGVAAVSFAAYVYVFL